MALDNEYIFAALPTPTDTPYRTPSRGISRGSSRRDVSLSKLSSSSPLLPPQDSYFPPHAQEKDSSNDEEVSPLDPRRFTPTLHASLVSEILSLRREVDNKNKLMDKLEDNLHTVEAKNDGLNEAAGFQMREITSLKKRLHSLENESLSAIDDISKERDIALETLTDTRRRLETSLSQQRSYEEDAERIQGFWDQDRQKWDVEKRGLDRKLHVAEGRLITVVAELAEAQAQNQEQCRILNEIDSPRTDSWFHGSEIPSTRSNSVKGHVRLSSTSDSTYNSSAVASTRFSAISGLSYYAGHKPTGLSLAEELGLGGDDEHHSNSGHASSEILPGDIHITSKPFSAQARTRRMLGFETEDIELPSTQDAINNDLDPSHTDLCHHLAEPAVSLTKYTESATYYSPPPSPKTEAQSNSSSKQTGQQSLPAIYNCEQTSDRVPILSSPAEQTPQPLLAMSKVSSMVSAGCQTVSEPPSPPPSPKTSTSALQTMAPDAVASASVSTQTNMDDMPSSPAATTREDTSTVMVIPAITIHPPVSAPPTPRAGVMLPPRTKSVGCQATVIPIAMVSSSMQTESRIQRGFPPRLPSSASSTKPISPSKVKTSPSKVSKPRGDLRRTRTPPRNALRKGLRKPPLPTSANLNPKLSGSELNRACIGFDQDGLLDADQLSDLKRPAGPDNQFPQVDGAGDQVILGLADMDLSDGDFDLAPPIRKTLTKVKNSWKLVSQPGDSILSRLESILDTVEIGESNTVIEETMKEPQSKDNPVSQAVVLAEASAKATTVFQKPNIRRAALTSSGVTSHAQHLRNPSAPGITGVAAKATAPPFPVPTRSSSRRIPFSASDGAATPTPHATSFFTAARGRDQAKIPARTAKAVVLRKVQSATTVPRLNANDRRRDRSWSPPPIMSSKEVAELPRHPPLPQDTVTSQYTHDPRPALDSQRPAVLYTPNNSVTSAIQPISVVDAIAQTMVGEWMWKYVRRRKSFGITESPQVEFEAGRNNIGEGSTGIRHKRWVWLAPYERAVMWSTKQPTSGSALLGKSGRKLAIQSVLDVKDDTPMPKNTNPKSIFGRSILILTPQRALKFTATTKERHQVWLSALSFLSHSTPGVDDLAILPELPRRDPQRLRQPSASDIRRNRNSVHIAKPKERPSLPTQHAYSSPIGGAHRLASQQDTLYTDDALSDAAEPPNIPRMASRTHHRKASDTGPRPIPPNSYRGWGTYKAYPSTHSLSTATSMDTHNLSSSARLNQKLRSGSVGTHKRSADAFQMPPPIKMVPGNNFFDAVGTMRMEAFVEGGVGVRRSAVEAGDVIETGIGSRRVEEGIGGMGGGEDEGTCSLPGEGKAKKPARNSYRTRQGRKKDMSWWGAEGRVDDPFGGF